VVALRDLQIQPLGVGGMIDRAVSVTRRHFRQLFVAMLLLQVPVLVLVRIVSTRAGGLTELLARPERLAEEAARLPGLLAGVMAGLLALQFLATAVTTVIVAPSLDGPSGATPPRPARRLARFASAGVLQLLALLLAPVLGALPGLALVSRSGSSATLALGLVATLGGALVLFLVALLRTALMPAVAAVEGLGAFGALWRSSRLMAPRAGQRLLDRPGVRASLLLLTTFLLALAVNGLASLPRLVAGRLAGGPLALLPGGLPAGVEAVLALFEACAGAALQPFSLTAVAVFYFERRARTEGLDLARWAERLGAAR
jgi:hypothetical protein